MQPGFRDILKPDRHVPWLRWRNHEVPRFTNKLASAGLENGDRIGKCKALTRWR
jgi:hypothetical protein